MAARGQAGNGDSAVLRHGHTVGGKAAEGHSIAHGGAGHGDGAAAFGLKAVLRTLVTSVEQNIMFCIYDR